MLEVTATHLAMALHPADIAVVSRLLDEALALPEAERAAWLEALAAEHQRHVGTLRSMLAQAAGRGGAPLLDALSPLGPDDAVAKPQDRIGPYRLLREIGRGGMGSVWLAERADGAYTRQVALKLPRLAWGAGLAERMALERDIGARLEHPNIARLYDAGVDERGRPYLALEVIDGQPIDSWCKAHNLDVVRRLQLFVQVIHAVSHAHGRLVVHRDLKPSNVLVTPDGQAHLLDFGIAKLLHEPGGDEPGLTQQQGRVLTPHYASPEQVAGGAITVQSDVYSLGVLLYELLTGMRPMVPKRSTAGALEEAILEGDAPLASSRVTERAVTRALRGEVDAILAKAMQREPAQRYATADALAQDIERHLRGDTVLARPDRWRQRLVRSLRRHRVAYAAAAAVTVAVLSGAGISLVQAKRANEEAERARVVKEFVVDVFKVNSRGSSANKQLRQLPAELLLEYGARLIETRFAGQPRLRAELFGVVGGIFADIGAYRLAADYSARQFDMLTALQAPRHERALAALLLAEIQLSDLKLNEAQNHARQALALAEGDAALHPRAAVLLTRVLRRQGRNDEALPFLGEAERQLKDAPGANAMRAQVKAIRAAYLSNQNQAEQAMPLYEAAISEALAAEGPLSPTAIDVRLIVARELAAQARGADADRHLQLALKALRDTGGAADVRAALEESEQAGRMFQMGQMPADAAVAAIRQAQTVLAARGNLVPARIRASIDFDMGKILTMSGDLQAADPLISGSAAVLRAQGAGPRERFQYASFQGLLAMYQGRHDQAAVFQREAIEIRKELGTSRHPFAIQDHSTAALNLLMQGRYDQAAEVLDAAPLLDAGAAAQPAMAAYGLLVPRARARLQLARGDARGALALLPPPGRDDWPPQFPYDDGLLRGQVLCAVGQSREGLVLMEKSIQWHRAKVDARHPELAYARAEAGLCALAQGDRARALEMLGPARSALLAQPEVSGFVRRPVELLASRLRVATPGQR